MLAAVYPGGPFLFEVIMKRLIIVATALVSVFISQAFANDFTVKTDDVPYSEVGGKKSVGYFARPEVDGNLPAIVLIHEWWGLNEDIRSKAREFAKLGYVALAVDMYAGKSTTNPSEARKLAGEVRGNMEAAQQNLRDAVETLKKSKHVDPNRIASIGWCFGGGWSYQMAKNNLGVKASVIYYGFFNPEDDLKKMRAEIIGHFAENDRAIRVDNVKEFQAKLKTTAGDHEIYIYPNTSHGFASRKGNNPVYNSDAAELAWKRTREFLEKHVVNATSAQKSASTATPDRVPAELKGLSGMLVGRLVSKDVEKGEFVIAVDYVPRVWRNNKAEKPRNAIGKTFAVHGVTGKWLDNLLLLKPGETMQVEVNHQRGDRFRFPGEMLEKAQPFDPKRYPIPTDEFRGFRGVVSGTVEEKFENSRELTLKVEDIKDTFKGSKAKDAETIIGKRITVAGFWVGKLRQPFDDMNPGDSIRVGLVHRVSDSDHFSVSETVDIVKSVSEISAKTN